MPRAAFGFAVHTGWAALLAAAGPAVLHREKVVMIAGGERFAYHAARELAPVEAERAIAGAAEQARAAAAAVLEAALARLRADGVEVVAAGIVVAERPAGELGAILENHSAVHAAEGALYRDALAAASAGLGLRVVEIPARQLLARGARALGVAAAKLPERLADIGRAAGRPWAKDQKDGFLAARLAMT